MHLRRVLRHHSDTSIRTWHHFRHVLKKSFLYQKFQRVLLRKKLPRCQTVKQQKNFKKVIKVPFCNKNWICKVGVFFQFFFQKQKRFQKSRCGRWHLFACLRFPNCLSSSRFLKSHKCWTSHSKSSVCMDQWEPDYYVSMYLVHQWLLWLLDWKDEVL